jgi:hypothetical protein
MSFRQKIGLLTIHSRALCQLSILKPKLAVVDFTKVLKLNPKNQIAKAQLDATKKLIRRIEFEKVSILSNFGTLFNTTV